MRQVPSICVCIKRREREGGTIGEAKESLVTGKPAVVPEMGYKQLENMSAIEHLQSLIYF